MNDKQVEFHSFLVEEGVVIAHYRSLYQSGPDLVEPPALWFLDEPPKRAVSIMGGSFVLNSAMIEDAEIMDSPGAIPGVLIPRPGEDGWQLAPVTDVPDWLLAAIGKKEDSGQ